MPLDDFVQLVNLSVALCILHFSTSSSQILHAKVLVALTIILQLLESNGINFSGTHLLVYAASTFLWDSIYHNDSVVYSVLAGGGAMLRSLTGCVQYALNHCSGLARKLSVIHEHRSQALTSLVSSATDRSTNDDQPDNYTSSIPRPVEKFTSTNITQSNQLLAGRRLTLDDGKAVNNDLNPYESRSITNQRLVTAFALSDRLRDDLHSMLDVERENAESAGTRVAFHIVPKIQVLCLKIVFVAFQDAMELIDIAMADDFFYELADGINKQWVASKNAATVDDWTYAANESLRSKIETLVGAKYEIQVTPQNTPFNYILPGYETLWRVVLRCYLEVVFRPTHQVGELIMWQKVLKGFVTNPCGDTLDAQSSGVSAAWIAKEALRLYPPTRRIYRRFRDDSHDIEAAADVEALHRQTTTDDEGRDTSVWGADTKSFQPSRWASITTQVENEHFLAFGIKPFVCVAKKGGADTMPFGVAMVALVTGVLVEQI
ncbi:Hypothetical protein D9617_7g029330 [Elsinoe fawcettii]|nr:Hypothetical protein D9617_7g029330 [Elsinoe fawcettii]